MKAMQLYQSPEGVSLHLGRVAEPTPGKAEVLIQVHAAGVTPTELDWYPTTHSKAGAKRENAIPGHEFSGTIVAFGEDVTSFTLGQSVYGMNDWFAEGATAEFCLTIPTSIAPKPATLTHAEAATIPIGALTAWQGLFDHAKLQPKQRVLIHGGAGAVGIFAVQLAHNHGAYVIATASTPTLDLVKQLGADEVIDYKTSRFQDLVHEIDVVFDTVGGETRDLSWPILKPEGRMITIAADAETSTDPRAKESFFIVEPSQTQLIEIAKLLDAGSLKTFVSAAVPLDDAAAAYAKTISQKLGYGKVVITLAD
ncbi:NADP-dependent oxidoreductase [Tunturibacter psychrotolerans]|uniref:NADP-dependent oxidoreductase n=1 Tax=Tunturiibacter psychrotolerans TaxID=3069686 RepID=A0AAU7ZS33_9BACT